jgi:hypothetical protein
METKPKLGHGGKRPGSGRPRVSTIKRTYKLEPETVERIKSIAQAENRTESSVVEEYLKTREEWLVSIPVEHAAIFRSLDTDMARAERLDEKLISGEMTIKEANQILRELNRNLKIARQKLGLTRY